MHHRPVSNHCRTWFFFRMAPTTEIYTLSLHDALPICCTAAPSPPPCRSPGGGPASRAPGHTRAGVDRKSTRLNSSHSSISYAVFCLKKKKHHSQTEQLFLQDDLTGDIRILSRIRFDGG